MKRVTASDPKDDVTPMDAAPTWTVASPASIPNFSAVGYFFSRELQRARDVPIGFIHSSWGGTPAEAWTRRAVLDEDPALQPILWQYRRFQAEYPSGRYGYDLRQPVVGPALRPRTRRIRPIRRFPARARRVVDLTTRTARGRCGTR